jgi:transcriptional regulator with GAF, ATPase, and Fis domain
MMLHETADGTADATGERGTNDGTAVRGLLVVFSGTTARSIPVDVGAKPLAINRVDGIGALVGDGRLSRQHAVIARSAAGWRVTDLGSRNGTFVDGKPVHGEVEVASPRVIRVGDTVLVPRVDACPAPKTDPDGAIVGAALGRAFGTVDRAASSSDTLLILGESGTGKELAARRFHERGPHAKGPFVAVNAATIPSGLAERLLFGAKRGTYTGATEDALGHLRAADGGVLFLDEAAELDPLVQAKLLRVLETREVVPLGASRGVPVSIRVCFATHGDLRGAVAAGKFRADLYHRISPPEVVLPPLRERLDEIAAHVVDAIAREAPGLTPQAKLVEACLLRAWPGNVRELRKHLRHAALHAAGEGADRVRIEHLPESAGLATPAPPAAAPPPSAPREDARRSYVRWSKALTREQVERVLAESGGNRASAARALGMQRSQLYRELERLAIPARA